MRMTLQPDLADLAPGDEAEFHVAMANDGADDVQVELDLQGLDADLWTLANPIPVIPAGQVGRTTIRVRLPEDATPGERRISVSVRDATGTVGASAAAALRVGSNDVIAIETDPASVAGKKGAKLDTIVRNRGDETLRLRVSGRSDGASVTIRPAEFDLPPGKGARLKARIERNERSWFKERRHGLVLDVRGGTVPATTSAIFVQKPIVPPVLLRSLAVLVALAVWASATFVLFSRMSATDEVAAPVAPTDTIDPNAPPPTVLLAGDVPVEDDGTVAPPLVIGGTVEGPRDLAGTAVTIERVSFGDEGTTDGSTGKVAPLTPVAVTSGTVLDKITATTDEKGRFRVASGLVMGAFYRVTAQRSGFDLRSQVVSITEETPEIELAMSLVPGRGVMSGRIVDTEGNPVGGATIAATQGSITYRTATASTGDAIGSWSLEGLATPSTYLITVAAVGYASQQLTVEVGGGATVAGVDAELTRDRGTIRGRITYRDAGVGAVTVALEGEVSRTTTTLTIGDLKGSFDFPNLPYGTYLLTFSAPGWLTSSREVTVTTGDVPVDVKDLLPSTAIVQGVVAQQVVDGGCDYPDPTAATAEIGAGSCGGVGVSVIGENGVWSTTTATGDGSFRISGVPAGEYTVRFERYGYLPEFYKVVIGPGDVVTLPDDATYDVEMAAYVGPRNRVLQPLDTESVQLRLVPTTALDAGRVTGIVRDAFDVDTHFDASFPDWSGGCRDERVDVVVVGQPDAVCVLSAGGGFELLGVAAGAADLVINAPGFGTYTTTIQVSPQGETQAGLIPLTPLASLILNVTGTGDMPVQDAVVFIAPTNPNVPVFRGEADLRECIVTRVDANDLWRERATVPDGHQSKVGLCGDADSAGDVSFARGLGTGSFDVILPVNGADPTDAAVLAGTVPMDHRQLSRSIDVRVGESARLDLRLRRYASIIGTLQIPNPSGSGYTNVSSLDGLASFPFLDLTSATEGVEFCETDLLDACLPYEFDYVTPRISFGAAAGLSPGQFRIDRIPPNEGTTLREYRLTIVTDEGDFEKSPARNDGLEGLAFGEVRTLNAVASPEPTDVAFNVVWNDGTGLVPVANAEVRVTGTAGFRTIDTPPYREELVLSCPSVECENGSASEDGFAFTVIPTDRTSPDADGRIFTRLGSAGQLAVGGVFRTGTIEVLANAPGFSERTVPLTLTSAAAYGGATVQLFPSPRDVTGSIVMTPTPSATLLAGLTATLTPAGGGAPLSASVSAAGRFTISNAPPGQYDATVSGPGVFTSSASLVTIAPGTGPSDVGSFAVARQLELDLTVYECPPGASCIASTYTAATDVPVFGATVQLFYKTSVGDPWPADPIEVVTSCVASAAAGGGTGCAGPGIASFDGLSAGFYRVAVAKAGYRPAAAVDLGEITAVATSGEFELTRFGSVTGTVRGVIASGDTSSTRLAAAEVTLTDGTTTYPSTGAFTTDASGTFTVPNTAEVPAGTYTINVSAEGYGDTSSTVVVVDRLNRSITLPITMVADPATISGQVTDDSLGTAIANVRVAVLGADCSAATSPSTSTVQCRWTDASGDYSGLVTPPRATTLVFQEYAQVAGVWRTTDRPTVERSVSPGLGQSVTVDLQMRSAIGSITGTIRLQDYTGDTATSTSGIEVTLFSGGNQVGSVLTTAANGAFTATEIPTGTYDVRITHPGYTTIDYQGLLVVANGTATVPTQTLTAKTRTVRVNVTSGGSALSSLELTLAPPVDFAAPAGTSGLITATEVVGSAGTYEFVGVAPGAWNLDSTNGQSLTPVHLDVDGIVVTVPIDTSATGNNAAGDVTASPVSFVGVGGEVKGSNFVGAPTGSEIVPTGGRVSLASDTSVYSTLSAFTGAWQIRVHDAVSTLDLVVSAGGYTSSTFSAVSVSARDDLDAVLIAKPRDLVLDIDSAGAGLIGLELSAAGPDGGAPLTTASGGGIVDNGDGTYTVAGVAPGSWAVSTTNGAALTPKHVDVTAVAIVVPVDTAATGAADASPFASSAVGFLALTGTVSGRHYVGAAASALPGATITSTLDPAVTTTTSGTGAWEVRVGTGIAGLSFTVAAGGYTSGSVSNASPSTTLTAKTRGATFSVSSGGAPLSGLTVTAAPPGDATGLATLTATDNGDGSYTIAGLAPGTWTFATTGATGLSPVHLDVETSDAISLVVPIDTAAAGAIATTTYSAGSAFTFSAISGTVRDAAGVAVAGAAVKYGGTALSTTAGDGTFSLRAPTGESRAIVFTGAGGSSGSVTATAPSSAADATLTSVSLTAVLRSSSDGAALAGATVQVTDGTTTSAPAVTDANGSVVFAGLGAGAWTIEVPDTLDGSDDGVITIGSSAFLIDSPRTGTGIGLGPRQIALSASTGTVSVYLTRLDKQVTGTTRMSSDNTVTGVSGVVVTASDGSNSIATTSGAGGAVSMNLSTDREWTVSFAYTDSAPSPAVTYQTVSRTVAAGSGGASIGIVNLASAFRTVSGTLTGPSGRTITITASANGYRAASTSVDVDTSTATYTLSGLSVDVTWRLDFAVTEGTTTTVSRWIGPDSGDVTLDQTVGATAVGDITVVVRDLAVSGVRTASLAVVVTLTEAISATSTTLNTIQSGTSTRTVTLAAGVTSATITFANLVVGSAGTGLTSNRFSIQIAATNYDSVSLTGLEPAGQFLAGDLVPVARVVTIDLEDSSGSPLSAVAVQLTNGTVTASTTNTSSNGYTFSDTELRPGPWNVTLAGYLPTSITVPIGSGAHAVGTVQLVPLTGNQLAVDRQPVGGASGATLSTQPQVSILGADGRVATLDNSTVVRAAISSGVGGTLRGTAAATAVAGVATFSNLGLDGIVGTDYVLTFTASGFAPVAAQPVGVTAGAPASADISVSKVGIDTDGTDSVTISAELFDTGGNPAVATGAVAITVGGSALTTSETGGVYSATHTTSTSGQVAVAVTHAGVALAGSAAISTSPGVPTSLTVSPGNGVAYLIWDPPTLDGGSAITDYVIERSSDGTNWMTVSDGVSTSASATVRSLTNGTEYTFKVSAKNAIGTGAASSTTTATPRTTSSAPIITGRTLGNAEVQVAFVIESLGGDTLSDIQYSLDGGSWTSAATTTSPVTIAGLANGTDYGVRLRTVLAVAGYSAASGSVFVTPRTTPSMPSALSAVVGDEQLTVSFVAGASGGAPITNYEFTIDGGSTWTALSPADVISPVTITGLANGTTVTVAMRAVNAAGAGAGSADTVTATPATFSTAPTITSVTPGDRQVAIGFTAGADGGTVITNYQYQVNGGAWQTRSPAATTSPLTITGLANGTAYSIRIRAVSSIGDAVPSATVTTTPRVTAAAPTSLSATAGSGSATIAFTPGDSGGSSIINYEYSTDGGSSWVAVSPMDTASPITVTGLTNGTTYLVTIRAVTVNGAGTASSAVSVTPIGVLRAPTGLTATASGLTSADLTWTAPSTSGGSAITDYVVQYRAANSSTWLTWTRTTTPATTASETVTGLSPGTTYRFRVAVITDEGTGDVSTEASATTPSGATAPGAPVLVAATPGEYAARLDWSAPSSTGGAAITDYIVEWSSDGGSSWTLFSDGGSTSTSAIVTSLSNGTPYRFRVSAVNSVGTGSTSNELSATPRTVPDAPSSVSATTDTTSSVTIAWSAPSSNGGAAISGYIIEFTESGGSSWTRWATQASSTTSVRLTGLDYGTSYDVRVAAINVAGTGAFTSVATAATATTP